MKAPALSAGRKPSGSAGTARFCAVAAAVDPAALGVLLDERRRELARRSDVEDVFARAAEVARVYARWFEAQGHTCPLPGQIAAARSKGLPSIMPTVDTLLYAELTTGVLMGVQDADAIDGELRFDWACEGESFTGFRSTVTCVRDEPVVRDATAIVASVLQGPDRRTSVTKSSRHLVFTVYDAPGLPAEAFDAGVGVLRELLTAAGSEPEVSEVLL
ncbi:phenylalanine--tRNA ligase beta subunit-related protein [Streptomyces sp. NPDC048352]|uniref:phenylalanine--tRNA ligase beta subunit-related protein n=1 Tax=Streptomyces sp. NPDC048352 TaxID=3154718 RepID=UPI0034170B08